MLFRLRVRLESVAFGTSPGFNGRIPRAFWNEIRRIVVASGLGHSLPLFPLCARQLFIQQRPRGCPPGAALCPPWRAR